MAGAGGWQCVCVVVVGDSRMTPGLLDRLKPGI